MTTLGLNHINFSGSRELLDRLKDFYCDVLGLTVGERPNFPRGGYWLYAGGQPILHLYESAPGEVRRNDVLTVVDHVALTCTDRDAVEERLRERGIRYDKTPVPGSTHVQLFVRDAAGTRVELNFDR